MILRLRRSGDATDSEVGDVVPLNNLEPLLACQVWTTVGYDAFRLERMRLQYAYDEDRST